jgi:hypothetical protein
MASRSELLSAGGISEASDRQTIAQASAGLPFYLNLAVDTYQQTGRHGDILVSPEEILARFLAQVADEEIATLEILSPARLFDYDIFRDLAGVFHLPRSGVAWNSLTAYSLIYPAGPGVRFHQLMGEALRRRLTARAAIEIHTLLRGIWDRRAAAARSARADAAGGAYALREAGFHALRTEQVTGPELLDYTDRAVISAATAPRTASPTTWKPSLPTSQPRRTAPNLRWHCEPCVPKPPSALVTPPPRSHSPPDRQVPTPRR